jgi:hypothetical protein
VTTPRSVVRPRPTPAPRSPPRGPEHVRHGNPHELLGRADRGEDDQEEDEVEREAQERRAERGRVLGPEEARGREREEEAEHVREERVPGHEVVALVLARADLREPGDRQQQTDDLREAEQRPAEAREQVEERHDGEHAQAEGQIAHHEHDERQPDGGGDAEARVETGQEPEGDGGHAQHQLVAAL